MPRVVVPLSPVIDAVNGERACSAARQKCKRQVRSGLHRLSRTGVIGTTFIFAPRRDHPPSPAAFTDRQSLNTRRTALIERMG